MRASRCNASSQVILVCFSRVSLFSKIQAAFSMPPCVQLGLLSLTLEFRDYGLEFHEGWGQGVLCGPVTGQRAPLLKESSHLL